jgi:hypothetical protein
MHDFDLEDRVSSPWSVLLMAYEGKLLDVEWKEAPGHPGLSYAEDGGYIVLKYFRTYVVTDWEKVEQVIDIKNQPCGKTRKPNPASVKRCLKNLVGEPANANKINAARLFIRLVTEGAIKKEEVC